MNRNPNCPNYNICLTESVKWKTNFNCDGCNGESDRDFQIKKPSTLLPSRAVVKKFFTTEACTELTPSVNIPVSKTVNEKDKDFAKTTIKYSQIIPKHEKEKIMENEKRCLIPDCPNKKSTKGLCSTHIYQWRHGKIDHPQLGKFPQAGETEKNAVNVKRGPAPEPKTELPIFSHLRNDLKRVKVFADVLSLLNQGDQVRLEIKAYLHEYI